MVEITEAMSETHREEITYLILPSTFMMFSHQTRLFLSYEVHANKISIILKEAARAVNNLAYSLQPLLYVVETGARRRYERVPKFFDYVDPRPASTIVRLDVDSP